jgi:multimeric flavodoxin WrbA
MYVLGVAGSPRKNGNSTALLEEALNGAKSNGAETKLIHACDLDITHCNHCDICLKTGTCCLEDDMSMIIDEIDKCDVLMIASPIHFTNVSSQLKLLIDRAQPLWAKKYIQKVPALSVKDRKAAFFSSAAMYGDKLFDGAIETVKSFLLCMDIPLVSTLAIPNIEKAGEVKAYRIIMENSFDIGKKLTTPY